MTTDLIELAKIVAELLFWAFRRYFETFEKLILALSPDYRRPNLINKFILDEPDRNIDERIRKIDIARDNLKDALGAIDEIRSQADRNKNELEQALLRLQVVHEQKAKIDEELFTLKQIAEADTSAFRKVVGLPSKGDLWRERLVGFASGVLASVVASFAFAGLSYLYSLATDR